MPPKRKAAPALAADSPSKRRTRLNGPLSAEKQATPTPSARIVSPASTPKTPLGTYGKSQRRPQLKGDSSAESLKKNGKQKSYLETVDSEAEGNEEDELNLSPYKIRTTPTRAHVIEALLPPTDERNGKDRVVNRISSIRRQPKHGSQERDDSINLFISSSPVKTRQLSSGETAKNYRRSKGQDNESDDPSSTGKHTSTPVKRYTRTARKQLNRGSQEASNDYKSLSLSPSPTRSRANDVHTVDEDSPKRGRKQPSTEPDEQSPLFSPVELEEPDQSPPYIGSPRRERRKREFQEPENESDEPSSPMMKGRIARRIIYEPSLSRNLQQVAQEGDPYGPSLPKKKLRVVIHPPPTDDEASLRESTSASPAKITNSLLFEEALPTPIWPTNEIRTLPTTPHTSPSKKVATPHPSPTRLPRILPKHLHLCLADQKQAILRALQNLPDVSHSAEAENSEDEEPFTNDVASQQLINLLNGTITRGEGNSCLLLGPRGSGKSRLVERCLSNLSDKPIIIRLSGWAQHSDRLAMREIAYQLTQQTGTSFFIQEDEDLPNMGAEDENAAEEPNPFLDPPASSIPTPSGISLPPSSHLPALISLLPTLSRPTIIVLDAFDLFALHPRQSLLYCLLDTVQSCRAGATSKGLGVIGITNRVDTINMLEKRVKSRFSGRILRTAPPRVLGHWVGIVKAVLLSSINHSAQDGLDEDENAADAWKSLWDAAVDRFLSDKAAIHVLNETFSVTRDVRMLCRILASLTLQLSPTSPFPSSSQLASAAVHQRARPRFPFLYTLPYPTICLLIACVHADTAGHPVFTFEMLHEYFRDQVRASTSAPVQVKGGSIGMVRCTREVLMSAFEGLVSARIFVCVAASSPSIAKEFVKYRCVLEREGVRKAVDRTGQINLKKWLTKAQ